MTIDGVSSEHRAGTQKIVISEDGGYQTLSPLIAEKSLKIEVKSDAGSNGIVRYDYYFLEQAL
ncbi:hypothetical protein PAUR_a1034 [Pseudoalteromonas aurantia 208]|uniref:Uncharacterized protein n=1 Tax=Pseudoalteromonas aurantia 208 TaxID=1314867 RepID=A0ABR9E9G0_9GAMM|nr:hypothetical protein [Pseudoalteromonas aurantia 208]